MMDNYGFYTGKSFDAYEFFGCHTDENGAVFRVFAPAAVRISVIGEFNGWQDTPMNKIGDGNFWAVYIEGVKPGQMYKYKIYKPDGSCMDHCDPYGYGMELRPASASIVRNLYSYEFQDDAWMKKRSNGLDSALNIYEIHAGSWKKPQNGWYRYDELATKLVPYLKEYGYNYIELLPIGEHPCDESWGYQCSGFYSPTSRYGTLDDYKKMIDILHHNDIGVIMDFVPVHFARDAYALAAFDGTALYEYPHKDVGNSEWGSCNFMHSRGEVRSFLQSCANYWLKEYHVDGLRMDAISNMIYWQGNPARGVNKDAVAFLQHMNEGLTGRHSGILLAAEDSTVYPGVTKSVAEGGLGFTYKWDMGFMHDTLEYFQKDTGERLNNRNKLTFSMHYFKDERYLLAFSHDEVVHGKATIIQKMNGDYDRKFPQARALYAYMAAHPGKKLNFMGNEIAHFREWDEKREQDWNLLDFPKHREFAAYMQALNHLYLSEETLWNDYGGDGFEWVHAVSQNYPDTEHSCVFAWKRKAENGRQLLCVFQFADRADGVTLPLAEDEKPELVFDTDWMEFGGATPKQDEVLTAQNGRAVTKMAAFSAKFFVVGKRDEEETDNMGADTTEAGEPITAEPIEKLSENSSVKLVDGAWFDRAVVYHIYPLGYCGAPQYNEGEKTQGSRILKVLDRIGHLKALGVNTIYFGPVFESLWHGYDTSDYYRTDSRLGSMKDFQKVFRALKENGFKIVLDGVFNHVGRGFEPFRDLQEKGAASIYKDWFCNVHFGSSTPLGDAFSYDTWQGNWELVKLNLKNKAVVDHLLGAVKMWVETFDIDGLRLDAADCIDKEFFKQLKVYTQGLKKDFWLMGEIIHGDYKMWANPDMMHSVTNYECWKGIYSSHNDKNYFEIAHSLRRQFAKGGIYENLRLYNFLDNHDVNRIASLLKNPADLENAYTMLFCMPGIPSVYYGSEWGIAGVKTSGKEADLPVRPPIEEAEAAKRDTKLEKHIAALARLRQTTNAPVYGEYADILVRNEQLVFVRQYNKEAVIAAFNIADTAVSLDFEWQGEKYAVELAPHDSRVIVKE